MSKIIGVTVGTPISPQTIQKKLKLVTSINGVKADGDGNVEIEVTPLSDEEVLKLQTALQ